MNVKPSDLDDARCEKCGNLTFVQVSLMKRIPALISPSSKEAFMPMAVFACAACGHVNDRFIQGLGGWFKSADAPEVPVDHEIPGSSLPGLKTISPNAAELTDEEVK
jgi:hypothetical protein